MQTPIQNVKIIEIQEQDIWGSNYKELKKTATHIWHLLNKRTMPLYELLVTAYVVKYYPSEIVERIIPLADKSCLVFLR